MKSPKFIGWAAVSSGAQARDEKVSLADQIVANLLACRRHDGEMLCQLIVPGESRSIVKLSDASATVLGFRMVETFDLVKDERLLEAVESHLRVLREVDSRLLVYAELDHLIERRQFDVLTFRNLGRIGRNAALSITIMNLCHQHDIIAYSTAAPPQSLDDAGGSYHRSLIDAITAVGYENEVREIKKRHETGMIRRIERGKFPGATPWGWREVRDEKGKITDYEIDEDAAATIRLLIQLYLNNGLSERATADELNLRGHTTATGLLWDKSTVRGILLKALRYAGINEINKLNSRRPYIKAEGSWPAIISLKDAEAIDAERKSRAPHRRTVAFTHRYSRMVYCQVCHRLMHQHNVNSRWTTADGQKKRQVYTQFRCMEHGAASATKITEKLEALIMQIEETIRERGYYEPDAPYEDTAAAEIAGIEQLIDRTKAGIERADTDFYVTGAIDEDRHRAITKAANERIEQLLATITALQDKRRQEENAASRNERALEIAKHGMTMLYHPDSRKANAWLRRHFEVYASSGTVHWAQMI
ncbi:MAG: recombinase family protein [Candidatus Competibacteraceae bacterium]|nr:recombinase family protein [Candidatus Competibacteraceae bacterium]